MGVEGGSHPTGRVLGEEPSAACPLFIKARRGTKAHCALCVFFHHFVCVLMEAKPPCGTLTVPFALLLSGLLPRLAVISLVPRVGYLSSFLRNDYLQACYVQSYDTAHNLRALSREPP